MDLIGNTPLVKLRHLPDDNHADVFVKFEAANPTGSMAEAGGFPAAQAIAPPLRKYSA